jgi:MFS family permease
VHNRALRILYLNNGIFVLGQNLLGPLYAVYVQSIDNAVLAISASWSVYLLSATFFTFLVARYGKRFREQNLYTLSIIIRAFAWLSFIFVDNIVQILALQVIIGFAEGIGTSTFYATIADHLEKGEYVKDFAYWQLISNLTMAISTLGGGLIVTNFGFDTLFIIMFTLAMTSFAGIYLNLKILKRKERNTL